MTTDTKAEALTTVKTIEAGDFFEAQRKVVDDRFPEPEGYWLSGVTVALLLDEKGMPVWFTSRRRFLSYFRVTLHWSAQPASPDGTVR